MPAGFVGMVALRYTATRRFLVNPARSAPPGTTVPYVGHEWDGGGRVLAEGLTALAAAGGAAVVQAAGTSAWQGFQHGVAHWFGRGDEERERIELERLDHCATALGSARGGAEAERLSIGQQGAWQARFEHTLEGMGDPERAEAARGLRALLDAHGYPSAGGVAATGDGQAVGGSVEIRADRGSAAALRMRDVTVTTPPKPDPQQG